MEIKYEPSPVSYRPVYISIDGTHHYCKADAIRHDAVSLAGTRYVEQESLELPYDETYMVVSHITCKEDWAYLYYTQWEQNTFGDNYTGPGWYGSIKHNGRDYVDEYEIIKIDKDYLNKYETFINYLKHDLSVLEELEKQ